ncbi:hypothetical protein MMPV_006859 [Pyropia vietnamensis]
MADGGDGGGGGAAAVDPAVMGVAEQIRTLARDRENQPIVAREDGCLSALISFLVPTTPSLAAVATDALVSLSSHPSNRELLRDEGDLFAALHALIVDEASPVPLRRSVLTILEELVDDDDGEEVTELHALSVAAGLVAGTPPVAAAAASGPAIVSRSGSEGAAGGGAASAGTAAPTLATAAELATSASSPPLLPRPVTTRLQVAGLAADDASRARVEGLLLRLPGVFSVGFELGTETAVVFGRVGADATASWLRKMAGGGVTLLPPEEDDEVEEGRLPAVPVGAPTTAAASSTAGGSLAPAAAPGAAAPAAPPASGYLDEGGQRLKDAERRARKKKKAVNAGASSLAARLDEQRKADARKRAKQERLLDRVGRGVGGGAPAATTATSGGGGFWRIW